MALVDSLRKASSKALSKFGGDVTVRIVAVGVYNTATGEVSEGNTDTTVQGTLADVQDQRATDLVQAAQKKLTIAAAAVSAKPNTKDKVVIGGIVHKIVRVETVELQNQAVTYELFLRV